MLRVGEVSPADPRAFDLLILGSPTHGGWFTEGIRYLLNASPSLEGVKVVVLDTRTKRSIFGFAANRIARSIEKDGGKLRAPPEDLIVLGTHCPLMDRELERAAEWARGSLTRPG